MLHGIGVGELTVDLPALVTARVGEMLKIPISLRNVGTEQVSEIDLRTAGTTYGVSVSADVSHPIGADEQREVPLQLTLSPDVSEGEREIKLVLASSAGSQTVAFRLDIQPRPMTLARLTPPNLPRASRGIGDFGDCAPRKHRSRHGDLYWDDFDRLNPAEGAIVAGSRNLRSFRKALEASERH